MKKFIQKLIHPFYKRYHFWYHRKPRKYNFEKVYTWVQPNVFSPINTVSTKVFLDYVSTLNLTNKKVLELGCGSGIISIQSAFQGAHVTASDINETAVKSVVKTAQEQDLLVTGIVSDLFNELKGASFDYIFINPPYYPKNPHNLEENAWFCGENFDFFAKLFSQLSVLELDKTQALMILSNACDLEQISSKATKEQLKLNEVYKVKLTFETNSIYRVVKAS